MLPGRMRRRWKGEIAMSNADWFTRPIVCVADVERSLAFYIAKLGFIEAWRHAENDKLLVAQVERDGCILILSCQWPEKNGAAMVFLSLDPPVLDAVRAEYEAKGVDVKDGHWGYRLMTIDDPDGNQLLFSYPQNTA
jgi:catechol 2,3-dioxygenase-like lactoylglutathione lyase family enzyme